MDGASVERRVYQFYKTRREFDEQVFFNVELELLLSSS